MKTLLEDGIYTSLSRWYPDEEEKKNPDDAYFSTDEESSSSSSDYGGGTQAFQGGKKKMYEKHKPGASVKMPRIRAPVKPRHIQKANPNALFVKYAELIEEPCISSSTKPLLCSKCQAAVNNLNTKSDTGWQCVFCKTENKDKITSRPEGSNIIYSLGAGESPINPCPYYVIIIDRSGSMSVTVSGTSSALQVLIEALKNILTEILSKNPKAKVGLIAVNNNVTVFGDCSSSPQIISDKGILGSEEKLKELANKAKESFFKNDISKSVIRITEIITSLKASSSTALGPSIVYGLELLKGLGNRKMMIFTDGLSNEGVGNIEGYKGVVKPGQKEYYDKWAKEAGEQGVSINFFAIENSKFDISFYAPIANQTEGAIYGVNPNNILTEIGLPEEVKQVGVDAEVTVILPSVLKFWRVIEIGAEVSNNRFHKKYGKLTIKTKEILHFVVNPGAMPIEEARYLETLPVQVKIKWRAMNGKDCLLICTKSFPVIRRRSNKVDADDLKDLIDKTTKDMVLQGKQDNADVELKNMLSVFLSKPENENEANLKEKAIVQRENVIASKTNTEAKTVLLKQKFQAPQNEGPKTTKVQKSSN